MYITRELEDSLYLMKKSCLSI